MNIYKEIIVEHGFMNFSIKGNSMEPLLRDGDLVRICKTTCFKTGDCYIFKNNDKLLLHRLAHRCGDYFYFIGDNSNNFEKVSREQICGVLYDSRCNFLEKKLISFINRLYLIIYKWWPIRRLQGFRKKAIRLLYRSFHEKTIPETSNLH